jgi:hypothetical protein
MTNEKPQTLIKEGYNKMKKLTWTLLALGAIAGCASTTANLQRETANFINAAPEDVTVSNVDRGATAVKWDAQAKGDTYKCNADDMVRRVHCIKK